MSYRQELIDLMLELERQARAIDFATEVDASEKHRKLMRQAEIISFVVNQPDQALENIKRGEGT